MIMPSHFYPGIHEPTGIEQDIFTPAPWSSLPLHTRQPVRDREADLFSQHYERTLRHRSTPLTHDDILHDVDSDSDSVASSRDSESDAGEEYQIDWAGLLSHDLPYHTPTPILTTIPGQATFSTEDIPIWQRGNRQWVEQHLWLLHQRSWDRSLLESSSSYINALRGLQMEQQTAERVPWLDVQREMQILEDRRVRRVQLNEEMNLFLEGWRARNDAEARLVRQRSGEEGLEEGQRMEQEEEDGEEEGDDDIEGEWLARSRSEARASSSGRRVSRSSSISFLDLSLPSC